MFIQRVICKMSVLVMFIRGYHIGVFDRCKPNQSLFVDVYPQWVYRGQSDIYSHVKFVAVKKEGVVDVLTYYGTLLQICDILIVICDEYTFSLRARTWLHNIISFGV